MTNKEAILMLDRIMYDDDNHGIEWATGAKEAFNMAISALEKQDVPEVNVGDTIDLQFLQPESEYVFYDSDHGFCINTQDVLDCLRKELWNG